MTEGLGQRPEQPAREADLPPQTAGTGLLAAAAFTRVPAFAARPVTAAAPAAPPAPPAPRADAPTVEPHLLAREDDPAAARVHPLVRAALAETTAPPLPPPAPVPAAAPAPPPPATPATPATPTPVTAATGTAPVRGRARPGARWFRREAPLQPDPQRGRGRRGRARGPQVMASLVVPPLDPPRAAGGASPIPPRGAVPGQLAATEAYRRFARETQHAEVEDYYRDAGGPDLPATTAATVAEDIAPTGPGRRVRRHDRSRAPLVAALALVVAGAGAAVWFLTRPAPVAVSAVPRPVVVDATTQPDGGLVLTVPRAATAGSAYDVTVPAGWRATSTPTRAGGRHTDVLVEQPTLRLSVIVRSEPTSVAPTPAVPAGTPATASERTLFGGVAAVREFDAGGQHRRVVTLERAGTRYVLDVRGPTASARQDASRLEPVLTGLRASR